MQTSTTGSIGQEEPPVQAHVADLPQHRQSALTLGRGLPMHQRESQRHPGKAQRDILTRSLGDLKRLLDVAQRGVVGQQHPGRLSPNRRRMR